MDDEILQIELRLGNWLYVSYGAAMGDLPVLEPSCRRAEIEESNRIRRKLDNSQRMLTAAMPTLPV